MEQALNFLEAMENIAPVYVGHALRGAIFNAISNRAENVDELVARVQRTSTDAFPYVKEASKTIAVGGERVGANFSATLRVGSNFDCAHDTFNYEAGVFANATLTLFDCTQTAVEAWASYGAFFASTFTDVFTSFSFCTRAHSLS